MFIYHGFEHVLPLYIIKTYSKTLYPNYIQWVQGIKSGSYFCILTQNFDNLESIFIEVGLERKEGNWSLQLCHSHLAQLWRCQRGSWGLNNAPVLYEKLFRAHFFRIVAELLLLPLLTEKFASTLRFIKIWLVKWILFWKIRTLYYPILVLSQSFVCVFCVVFDWSRDVLQRWYIYSKNI